MNTDRDSTIKRPLEEPQVYPIKEAVFSAIVFLPTACVFVIVSQFFDFPIPVYASSVFLVAWVVCLALFSRRKS